MSGSIKAILYVLLISAAAGFGYVFFTDLPKVLAQAAQRKSNLIDAAEGGSTPAAAPRPTPGSNAPASTNGTGTPTGTNAPSGTNPPSLTDATNTATAVTNNNAVTNLAETTTSTNAGTGSNDPTTALSGTNADGSTNLSKGTEAKAPHKKHPARPAADSSEQTLPNSSRVWSYGAGFALVMVFLALLLAHDVSQLIGDRFSKVIFDHEGTAEQNPEYDQAEQVWANGDYLEAIQLMRDYLKKNPREVYVAFRIAEIYEGNLKSWLAAALEYEEILKHKLPADRWGWAAIHLANLYSGRLGKADKAMDLLHRVDAECGDTPSARKARERLAQFEPPAESDAGANAPIAVTPSAPELIEEPPPPSHNLPRGFRPKD